VVRIIDFLDFSDFSFLPNSSIGQLCEDLNTIVGMEFGTIHFKLLLRPLTVRMYCVVM